MDLERLSQSIDSQNVQSTFDQINEWIDVHGATLLRTNQRLPFNYSEAEEIRKQHEKVELKCMKFLAFYAKINLKSLPPETVVTREKMDLAIHQFSDKIKARRHVVVSFYTFYRHLQKLEGELSDVQNEDLASLPDNVEGINDLIAQFTLKINKCLKSFAHLRDEAARANSSLDSLMTLSDALSHMYIDLSQCDEARVQIDSLLRDTECLLTRIFESQQLLQLELKIESKIMVLEGDMGRCCHWLGKMTTKLREMYRDRMVGMVTIENDNLRAEVEELVKKMKLTYDYGRRLMDMYHCLCNQFHRDVTRGRTIWENLHELWKTAEIISTEVSERLTVAGQLFHRLDGLLGKIEDALISINKVTDITSIETSKIYNQIRKETVQDLECVKKWANELFVKVRYDLYNEKLQLSDQIYLVSEQTENMIKMKIFTIVVKLKELDRYLLREDIPVRDKETTDEDLVGNIDKYFEFLGATRRNWDSKSLPVTLKQVDKAIADHQDVADHSEHYWRNVELVLQSLKPTDSQRMMLIEAARERASWNEHWNTYLEKHLTSRRNFLGKVQKFGNEIASARTKLIGLIGECNDNISVVKDVKRKLVPMKLLNVRLEQIGDNLHEEGSSIHKLDFLGPLSAMDDNLENYRDQFDHFLELEDVIEEILDFLPKLHQFKKHMKSGNNQKDRQEAELMKKKIGSFDVNRLRKLAEVVYGDSTRVEGLIYELRGDLDSGDDGNLIRPQVNQGQEGTMNGDNATDQYNNEWLRDLAPITPKIGPRLGHINSGQANLVIGDPPSAPDHCITYRVNIGDPLTVTIPITLPTNNIQHKVVWKKDSRTLSQSNTAVKCRINKNHNPVLEIAKVKPINAGTYTCEVSNIFGSTSIQVVLDVVVTAKQCSLGGDFPDGGSGMDRFVASVGESVVLATTYSPANNTNICWTKDEHPLSDCDPRIQVRVDQNRRCTLLISDTRTSDSGKYTASIRGTNRYQSTVLEIRSPSIGPVIEKYPDRVGIKTNEPLEIECLIRSAAPCSGVKWTFYPENGGGPIDVVADTRHKLTENIVGGGGGDGSEPLQRVHLCVDPVTEADAGEYVMRYDDHCGFNSVRIPVTVAHIPALMMRPPAFLQSLKREVTSSGDGPVVLTCKVMGEPHPRVYWTKNGREVVQTHFIKISSMGGVNELCIFNPRSNDSGIYEIVASNSEGSERSQCLVTVMSPPRPEIDDGTKTVTNGAESSSGSITQRTQLVFCNTVLSCPPKFETTFADQVVKESRDVVLRCRLLGLPEPLVWWSYNTHLLDKNPRYEVSRTGNECKLLIRRVREDDTGRYSVTAENNSGLATCSALVVVEPIDGRQRTLDITKYKANSKPVNNFMRPSSPFKCSTTLSQSIEPQLADDSRIMQVCSNGWDKRRHTPIFNSAPDVSKPCDSDLDSSPGVDFTRSKTKTVKTYHYSGPGGIELPGIGYIPRRHSTQSRSPSPPPLSSSSLSSSLSSSSSEGMITRAIFVPGIDHSQIHHNQILPGHNTPVKDDLVRFSVVESSDCDYNY